jgi:hypothetical protein
MLRASFVSLFVVSLLCLPAWASQPDGLAGEIITNAVSTDNPCGLPPGFPLPLEWYDGFGGSVAMSPDAILTMDLAIVPFASGTTAIGLDEGVNGATFVSVPFSNGSVLGLPYRRSGWNDVTLQARPATQDFLLTVNGLQAGPFPFSGSCSGGCSSVQAFRLGGSLNGSNAVAWIDSLFVTLESPTEYQPLVEFTADACSYNPVLSGGAVVFAAPPQRLGPGR